MDVEAERQHLLNQIKENAEPGFQELMSKVIPTGLKVYGVRTPVTREMARSWQRAHRDVDRDELFALVSAMWDGESREERIVALELLQHHPKLIPDLTREHFDRWRRDLDNWELTDVLGVAVLGPWVVADQDERAGYVRKLVADEDVWSRRLGLVSAVGMNRAHKGISFPDFTLELIDQLKEERHPMITKAVSWALRDVARRHPDQAAAYVESNRDVLAAHVVREVSNKLQTGSKTGKPKKRRDPMVPGT